VSAMMVEQRYIMFALFAGLAWGGVPVVYSMARPTTKRVFVSAAIAFVIVVALTSLRELSAQPIADHVGFAWFFLGGLLAAAAMVLPGVSAAYILALLGLYGPLMDAVDALRNGYATDTLSAGIARAMPVFIPMGLGVLVGLLGVANLFKRLLYEQPKATLGALLGFLVGSLVTLWPFQRKITPAVGDVINGRVMTSHSIGDMPIHRYPVEYFMPDLREVLMASAVFFLGCMLTVLVARFTVRSGESGFDAAARSQG
jgi:putative membrane protein